MKRKLQMACYPVAKTDKLWRITGTRHGREWTVRLRAPDYNEAVRRGSHAPHMLVVRDVFLLDEPKGTK